MTYRNFVVILHKMDSQSRHLLLMFIYLFYFFINEFTSSVSIADIKNTALLETVFNPEIKQLSVFFHFSVAILKGYIFNIFIPHSYFFTSILLLFFSLPRRRSYHSKLLARFSSFHNSVKIMYLIWQITVPKSLTHFRPFFPFYTPCKYEKISGFLIFFRGLEKEHWPEIG